jgi:hypothetical protein
MTSIGNGHLTDKQLLFYVDGELSPGEGARVRTHLEACWTCRAKLDDLQASIKKIVDFRDQVLLPMVPAPPWPWIGLSPRMQELDKTLRKPSLADRLSALFRSSLLSPRYVVFVVLVVAAVGAMIWWPSQPTMSANELLERVQAAQSADLKKVGSPVLHQKLRVRRTMDGSSEQVSTDYDAWEDHSRGRFRQTGPPAKVLAELRSICESNQLDWRTPLSAAGFGRWRDSLPAKRDFIASENVSVPGGKNDSSEALALTTVAMGPDGSGPGADAAQSNKLVKAELVIRTADWHAIEERLWVNDREFEIAGLDYRVMPFSEVDASIFAESAPPVKVLESPHPQVREVKVPEMRESVTPLLSSSSETEMAVRYGLYGLDADFSEQIQITTDSKGEVVVEASDVRPELRAKLEQQLGPIPNVRLEFTRPSASSCDDCPAASPETAKMTTSSPPGEAFALSPNDRRLEEIFGDSNARESFTREVMAASGDALAHCSTLRNLALRYPPQEEALLAPISIGQLDQMVEQHLETVVERTNLLRGLLQPLLGALSNGGAPGAGSSRAATMGTPSDRAIAPQSLAAKSGLSQVSPLPRLEWQSESAEVFGAVQKTDLLVKELLTNPHPSRPVEDVFPDLSQTLATLQRELDQLVAARTHVEKERATGSVPKEHLQKPAIQ